MTIKLSLLPLEEKYYRLVYGLIKDMVKKNNSFRLRRIPPFAKFIKRINEDKKFIIQLGNAPIGFVSITDSNEIGYHLLRQYRGKGYATKAVKMMMKKEKREFYLATINLNNKQSLHFAERLNFKPKAIIMEL